MAAEIWIGGKIPASLVPDLCTAISDEGVCVEWADARVHPSGADELTQAIKANAQGVRLLWFCDDQACCGEFDVLESFLQEHGIPFDRKSAGRYEYDPQNVCFRPGHGLVRCPANSAGESVVAVSELTPVNELLSAAIELSESESKVDCWSLVKTAQRLLSDQLPSVPPLEPFEIESAEDESDTQEEAGENEADAGS
jgi:hypothetical protein